VLSKLEELYREVNEFLQEPPPLEELERAWRRPNSSGNGSKSSSRKWDPPGRHFN